MEAEFKRDPKPDKAARQRIVERVALGDKEVQVRSTRNYRTPRVSTKVLTSHSPLQIWFQNRRQTSRRKSKPLEPHELWDPRGRKEHDTTSLLGPTPASSAADSSSLLSSSPRHVTSSSPVVSNDTSTSITGGAETRPANSTFTPMAIDRDPAVSFGLQTDAAEGRVISSQDASDSTSAQSWGSPVTATHGAIPKTSEIDPPPTAQDPTKSSSRSLKRSASTVRLSLTSDYTAKIMQPDEASPSPPKPQRSIDIFTENTEGIPRSSLRRSFSAAGLSSDNKATPLGRSRDSRAWEFWCDRDARTDLMKLADQETRGSAADAISLIRSTSQRKVLIPLAVDSRDGRDDTRTLKRAKSNHHGDANLHHRQPHQRPRPKLERAQTSVGRIEGHYAPAMAASGKAAKRDSGIGMENDEGIFEDSTSSYTVNKPSRPRASSFGYSPASESDKENIDPEDDSWTRRRGIAHTKSKRKKNFPVPTLRGSVTAPLASTRRFGSSMLNSNGLDQRNRTHRQSKHGLHGLGIDSENADMRLRLDDDEEVAAFMAGGRSASSASVGTGRRDEDDMDCVQGLLSLSQGAWR